MKTTTITLGKLEGLGNSLWLDLLRLIETRLLVMASSGGGKSYLLRKVIEAAYGKIHIIILDPEGEFRTLRPSHDFVILGKGGDVDLVPQHAATYARKFLELRRDVIVDLYELDPQARKAFVRDFLQAMVDAPRELWHEVLVILDEAHEFAPERSPAVSSNAVIAMASKGRKRGFALLMASQRLSKLSKDAAAECQNKLVGLANLPDDRKRGAEELGLTGKDEVLTLRDMEQGEFYACGPAFLAGASGRLKGVLKAIMAMPQTRPPKRGSYKAQAPAASAKLKRELDRLKELPKEALQEIKDKAALQAKIRELEGQLRAQPKAAPAPTGILQAQAEEATRRAVHAAVQQAMEGFTKSMSTTRDAFVRVFNEELDALRKKHPALKVYKAPFATPYSVTPAIPKPKVERMVQPAPAGDGPKLVAAERSILSFLNTRPGIYFKVKQVAAMTGYKFRGGGFVNAVGRLCSLGYVERASIGIALAPGTKLPDLGEQPKDLKDWIKRLDRAPRLVFEALLSDPAKQWPMQELADLGSYAIRGGGFVNGCGKLCSLGLATRPSPGFLQLNPDLHQFL